MIVAIFLGLLLALLLYSLAQAAGKPVPKPESREVLSVSNPFRK